MNFSNLTKLMGPELSFDIKALFSNRLLQRISIGLLGLFLPIFLFEHLNYSIQSVILFYIISSALYIFLIPLGAMSMSRLGLKHSMMIATVFLAGYYLSFYFFDFNFIFFLALALIMVNLFRIFYWVPYHTDFTEFTNSKRRGRQVGFLNAIIILVGIILPILAGFIIERFGFNIIFLMSVGITLISIIPLFLIKKVCEEYSYSYFQTFREVFKPANRKLLIGYGADGAQTAIGLVIWPIFIYQLLNEQYFAVGAISSAIILATVILNLVMGSISDKISKRHLIKIGTIFFSLGWFLKAFIQTGFQIFVVDSYHSFAGAVRGVPFSAFIYQEMADSGHYIDEYTVVREISLNIGKMLILIASFILIGFIGLNWIFLLAAIVSLFVSVL